MSNDDNVIVSGQMTVGIFRGAIDRLNDSAVKGHPAHPDDVRDMYRLLNIVTDILTQDVQEGHGRENLRGVL